MRIHFSFHGMIARAQLAAMYFSDGVNVQHAVTKAGDFRYAQVF